MPEFHLKEVYYFETSPRVSIVLFSILRQIVEFMSLEEVLQEPVSVPSLFSHQSCKCGDLDKKENSFSSNVEAVWSRVIRSGKVWGYYTYTEPGEFMEYCLDIIITYY